MKAIMYHYVREFDSKLPYFRYLDVSNFRRQLDYFRVNYDFLTYSEWCDFINLGIIPKQSGKVILTFDDALSCHYDYVFPELVNRGLWGIFYVPTAPYINNKLLDVHRVHLLCGAYPGRDLLEFTNSILSERMIPDETIDEFRNLTYSNHQDESSVIEFKRLMNYFISYKYRSTVIDHIAKYFDLPYNVNNFYIPFNKLYIMKQNGMVIGSHSHNHPVMSKLSMSDQNYEIEKSFSVLGDLVDETHKTYCHPYGGFHSFDNQTINALNFHGVSYSFNVEFREIEQVDYKFSKHHMPRFDCNFYPYGTAS